jgi:hypothetical protein
METIHRNISGNTAVKILSASNTVSENSMMTICNIDTTDCNVSMFYSKENYEVTYNSSIAKVTITDYTELNSGDKVNLIATDGTNYDFTNGSQSSVNGTWESTTSNDVTATNLMNVINTASGPSGTRFTATVDGAVVTITQTTQGVAGNTTVALTDSNTAGMTLTNSFTGGADTENVTTEIYYILKSFTIPNNKTLTLDKTDFVFSNKGFDLYIELGSSTESVDLIINI